MRTQINAQLDRDQVHTKRINSIKKAILNDPSNIKLKQRLSNTLNEDKREREMLLNIAKTGDQCASCRTRVLSVMETAVQHGFEEKRLPEYMSSFCEVRLAITGKSKNTKRCRICSVDDISTTFPSIKPPPRSPSRSSLSKSPKQTHL